MIGLLLGLLLACSPEPGALPAMGAPMPTGAAYEPHLDGRLEACVSLPAPHPAWRALACGCEGRLCQVTLNVPREQIGAAEMLLEAHYPTMRVVTESWPIGGMVRAEDAVAVDSERARVLTESEARSVAERAEQEARCEAATTRLAALVEEPSSLSAGLDAARVEAALRKHEGRLVSCYEHAVIADRCTMGEVRARLVITGGRVADVTIVRDSTADATLASCAANALRGFRFDPGDSGVVEQSWVLEGWTARGVSEAPVRLVPGGQP